MKRDKPNLSASLSSCVNVYEEMFLTTSFVSWFTVIPLKESIDLPVSYITEGNPCLKLSKTDLTNLASFATSQTNFLFNRKMYNQIDGVPMGSPLAPV